MFRSAASIVVFGAVVAPHVCPAQPPSDLAVNDERQRQIVDEIRQVQAENGAFSDELIAPLTALGLFYREGGDRVLARGAIDQARQVVRANYGLHALEEAPLMRQAIENDEAIGQFTSAWNLEQQLLDIVARHPEDGRTASILTEVGDRRTTLLEHYLSGELPPQIVLGCYYRERMFENALFTPPSERQCYSGSRDTAVQALRTEARSYYLRAIGTLLRTEGQSSPALQPLERRVIANSYDASVYSAGRSSYRRLMNYEAANVEPWLARVTTAIELADWDLMFGQGAGTIFLDEVLHEYAEARRLLEQGGVERASIDELFTPSIPIMLPTFRPNPLASKRTPESTAYVDVAFRITKYGRSQHVRILDSTTNVSAAAELKLVRLIKGGRFRPRPSEGGYEDSVPVVVRYYFNDPAVGPPGE